MAKTTFVNGSDLLPAYVNSIFGTGATGGHHHDAVDADGHADKIDLASAAEVKGLLPIANMEAHASGSFGVKITTSYLTVEQTGTCVWAKANNIITLTIPYMTGTSNSVSLKIGFATTFPTELRPSDVRRIPVILVNDSKYTPGSVVINQDQDWEFSVMDMAGATHELFSTGFVNSGTKGVYGVTVTYLV